MTLRTEKVHKHMPVGIYGVHNKNAWIARNIDVIREYLKMHSVSHTAEHFGISKSTANRISTGEWTTRHKQEVRRETCKGNERQVSDNGQSDRPIGDSIILAVNSGVSASDVAHSLVDMIIDLKSQIHVLTVKNENLQCRLNFLEKKYEEEVDSKRVEFAEKLKRAYAEPGEVSLNGT